MAAAQLGSTYCLGVPNCRYASNPLVANAAGEVQLALQLTLVPSPGQPFAVVQGDSLHFQYWHRDGLPSGVATSNTSDALTLTFCPGQLFSGALTATLSSPRNLSLVDADADGDLDAVVSAGGSADALHPNTGDGTFAPLLPLAAIGGTVDHALGDLDGDGWPDLVAVSGGPTVTVRPGLGAAGFGPAVVQPIGNVFDLAHVAVGDLEGDGDVDVVVAGTQAVVTLLNDGAGNLTPLSTPISVGVVTGLALGDLDADGHQDLALTGGVLALLRGLPGGGWAVPVLLSAPPAASTSMGSRS
jgi:hypothetical protein